MRIEKGQPGYLNAQKVKYLIWALGEFIVVVGLVVLGYIQTGSKLNLFTVAAVVCCTLIGTVACAKLVGASLPILADVSVGHALPRCILPFGVNARVDAQAQTITFDAP